MDKQMTILNMKAEVDHFKILPLETKKAIAQAMDDEILTFELAERLVWLRSKNDAHGQVERIKR